MFGVRFPHSAEVKYKSKKQQRDKNKIKSWFFCVDNQEELLKWLTYFNKAKAKFAPAPTPAQPQAPVQPAPTAIEPAQMKSELIRRQSEVDLSDEIAYLLINYERLLKEKQHEEASHA
eukprot:TRINITY_DN9632_c0_g1_i1.p1 TRINITY_DN9632_c0_g1~~TRINITY_DN9632_c0_g1_i1.p1  ORF type:complete len:118 (+),score=33.71 TRINITY_DN9632_c0_g1_i1:313-666(+)